MYQYSDGAVLKQTEVTQGEETATVNEEFDVYDSAGNQIMGVKRYKLADESEENNYKHTSNIWDTTAYALITESSALRPMASFSNAESEYALLSSNAWADNKIKRYNNNS